MSVNCLHRPGPGTYHAHVLYRKWLFTHPRQQERKEKAMTFAVMVNKEDENDSGGDGSNNNSSSSSSSSSTTTRCRKRRKERENVATDSDGSQHPSVYCDIALHCSVKSRKRLHRLVPFQTALIPSNIPYSNCHEYGTLRTSDIADCHKLQSIGHTSTLKMSGLSMYFESTF